MTTATDGIDLMAVIKARLFKAFGPELQFGRLSTTVSDDGKTWTVRLVLTDCTTIGYAVWTVQLFVPSPPIMAIELDSSMAAESEPATTIVAADPLGVDPVIGVTQLDPVIGDPEATREFAPTVSAP